MLESRFIFANEKFIEAQSPFISAQNRSFRYGDGFFETLCIVNGTIRNFEQHEKRILHSLKVLNFELPAFFSIQKVKENILKLAEKNGQLNLARCRVNFYRGDGGLFDAVSLNVKYCIETYSLQETQFQFNNNGIVLGFFTKAKKPIDEFANLKTNNFLPYIQGALWAKQNKWNDAIVLNTENNVADTCIANIFLVKDNIVYTPALNQAPIAGTMRASLINFLQKNNYNINETCITQNDVLNADEVFLTNATYKIRWVGQIQEKQYANSFSQDLFKKFNP